MEKIECVCSGTCSCPRIKFKGGLKESKLKKKERKKDRRKQVSLAVRDPVGR